MSSVEARTLPLARIAVLMPTWQPESLLRPLVEDLATRGFGVIVVVDDGSGPECAPVFAALEAFPNVTLLRHAVNLGKGRALKTGIHHILSELPWIEGLVTADADGQHTPVDIERVAQALDTASNRPVLGVRGLTRKMPLRSRFGNSLTRRIFARMTGVRVTDTQTGLRAFARATLPELLDLDGERYEYEMNVLAHLCRNGRAPLEVPIETIYIDGNCASRFDPIRDSIRIYRVLLRHWFRTTLP